MEDARELGVGRRRRGRERWKRRGGIRGEGQLEGVVEGDGGVAERGGGCERLEEALCGCGRGPGDVEVVEHCGGRSEMMDWFGVLLFCLCLAGHYGQKRGVVG